MAEPSAYPESVTTDRQPDSDVGLVHLVMPSGTAGAPEPSPPDGAAPGPTDDAAYELWRQDFLQEFDDKMAALRRDEDAWEDYLAEAEMTSVADGID